MNHLTDQQLLQDYAANRAEASFTELVRRNIDFVYSVALRLVCDPHLAKDVAQGVFLALAKNAGQLHDRLVLSGWLYRTTQNLAANAVRSDVRRRTREQEAAAMIETPSAEPDAIWEQIAPALETALDELPEADRDVLFLRFFQHRSTREISDTLGISEDAAKKRVSRAVEKLREFFTKRGVTVGAAGIILAISTNAVHAAPIGLVVVISGAVGLVGASVATAATTTATQTITMTILQKSLVTITVAVLAGTGIYKAFQASQQRSEIKAIQQLQASLIGQVGQLKQERDEVASQVALLRADNEQLNRNGAELLRLRGEVALLRADSRELAKVRTRTTNETAEEAIARTWAAKVDSIKDYSQRNPSTMIPEIKFVSERDWKESIDPSAKYWPLKNEGDYRQAMDILRDAAQLHFEDLIRAALIKFSQETKNPFPSDLAQLRPYFDPGVGEVLAEQWEIVPVAKLPTEAIPKEGSVAGDSMIARKSAARERGQRLAIVPTKRSGSIFYDRSYY